MMSAPAGADEEAAAQRTAVQRFFNASVSLSRLVADWSRRTAAVQCYCPEDSRVKPSRAQQQQQQETSNDRECSQEATLSENSAANVKRQLLLPSGHSATREAAAAAARQQRERPFWPVSAASEDADGSGRAPTSKSTSAAAAAAMKPTSAAVAGAATPSVAGTADLTASAAPWLLHTGAGAAPFGVRVLQIPVVECFFSFLCSSNNNISRITQIVAALRRAYGRVLCEGVRAANATTKQHRMKRKSEGAVAQSETPDVTRGIARDNTSLLDPVQAAGTVDSLRPLQERHREFANIQPDTTADAHAAAISMPLADLTTMLERRPQLSWHTFPTVDTLAAADEQHLKTLGLGYRARLLCAAAKALHSAGGESYLLSLKALRSSAQRQHGDLPLPQQCCQELHALEEPSQEQQQQKLSQSQQCSPVQQASEIHVGVSTKSELRQRQLPRSEQHQDEGTRKSVGFEKVLATEQRIQDALVQFSGVGRKVADCIALCSLGCWGCWPVDRHLLAYAAADSGFFNYVEAKRRWHQLKLQHLRAHQQLQEGGKQPQAEKPYERLQQPKKELEEGRAEQRHVKQKNEQMQHEQQRGKQQRQKQDLRQHEDAYSKAENEWAHSIQVTWSQGSHEPSKRREQAAQLNRIVQERGWCEASSSGRSSTALSMLPTPAAMQQLRQCYAKKARSGSASPTVGLKQVTVSDAMYKTIQEYYRFRFGPYAGWAESFIFADALRRKASSSAAQRTQHHSEQAS